MITKQAIYDGAMWTVFHGEAEHLPVPPWFLSYVNGYQGERDSGDPALESKLATLGYETDGEEPERDDELCQESAFTDEDAWLAYLNVGGTLCKVPDSDEPGCGYYRLLVVRKLGANEEDDPPTHGGHP